MDLGQLINGGSAPTCSRISNGIGRVTTIGYKPSTEFALSDAAGGPVAGLMPFPVTVVATVTNSIRSATIRHPVPLPRRLLRSGEKQFRGFARVEQIDVGDATAPTLVTRSLRHRPRL